MGWIDRPLLQISMTALMLWLKEVGKKSYWYFGAKPWIALNVKRNSLYFIHSSTSASIDCREAKVLYGHISVLQYMTFGQNWALSIVCQHVTMTLQEDNCTDRHVRQQNYSQLSLLLLSVERCNSSWCDVIGGSMDKPVINNINSIEKSLAIRKPRSPMTVDGSPNQE